MELKFNTIKTIDVSDWDKLVSSTYGKVYNFQQQDGCKDRGMVSITVPTEDPNDYQAKSVPEIVNHPHRGVSFASWLARDVNQRINEQEHDFELRLWWWRNFYPDIDMVINDLYEKGILPAGEYYIDIDW